MNSTTMSTAQSWLELQNATNAILTAASTGDWLRVLDLSVARHQKLVAHFEAFPVGPENSEFYRERINEMLIGEQTLQELTLNARKEVMRSALANTQNHRAVGAYLSTATR